MAFILGLVCILRFLKKYHALLPLKTTTVLLWACACLGVVACTSSTTAPTRPQKTNEYRPIPASNRAFILRPFPVQQDDPKLWPDDFKVWFISNYQDSLGSYTTFLKRKRLSTPRLHQLYRTARSWEKCGVDTPYTTPYFELWPNMLPTLDLLDLLQSRGIIPDYEITSSYRDVHMNRCVGGAPNSKHTLNAAVDFRVLGADGFEANALFVKQLCDFWMKEGPQYNMGLGVYTSGIIHVDTQGYRTWGPDYTWRTSLCSQQLAPPPLPPSESCQPDIIEC